VLISLLVGMLMVIGVTGGSMLLFSDLVVQRQVDLLPVDLRDQFHDHSVADEAIRPAPSMGPFITVPQMIGPVLLREQISQMPHHTSDPGRTFTEKVGVGLGWVFLVSVVFGLLVAVFLARRIARPISAVSRVAVRVAAGDLGARAPLVTGDRETTELARHFNGMAQGLQALEWERRETVASIVQQLPSLLTVMQARLDALQAGTAQLDQEEVEALLARTQALTQLVNDLRRLSRAPVGN